MRKTAKLSQEIKTQRKQITVFTLFLGGKK